MKKYILAIDQGTTSTRVIAFNKQGEIIASSNQEIKNIFVKPGWVEQDANDIWLSTLSVLSHLFINNKIKPEEIVSIGITNQRETTVVWDKRTGIPIYKAIVWQSRQSDYICEQLKTKNYADLIHKKTGLLIDAYFSATKIKWILDNVEGAKEKAENGDLLFGTIDSWLLWNLSKNKVHATDYSNASRTMLYNINDLTWDQELLDILDIPQSLLPQVENSATFYDVTNPDYFFGQEIPITALIGDQQASLFGHKCLEPGEMKNTYGTGCFMLMNVGNKPIYSSNGLLTTIAWGLDNKITYAFEGSIFVAGSAIQWLRDELKIINSSSESEAKANQVKDNGGVYVVPAFVGLGSPYWDMEVKAAILGLTRGSNDAHIVRATLEAIAYQVKDIIELMQQESAIPISSLNVDGGASANNLLMQFQADILNASIILANHKETTALGCAYLAGLNNNFFEDFSQLKHFQSRKIFYPKMNEEQRVTYYQKWLLAINCVRNFK